MDTQLKLWITAGIGGALVVLVGVIYLALAGLPSGWEALWYGRTQNPSEAQKQVIQGSTKLGRGAMKLAVGDAVPDGFALPDRHGDMQYLADFAGTPVLLNFWASWCEPCREEMPLLATTARQHDDIQIIGIAMDRAESIQHFLQDTPVPYPIWMGLEGAKDPQVLFGDPKGLLPYSVLIDKDGQIVAHHLGKLESAQIENWLDRL